jgi:hypothetical protein
MTVQMQMVPFGGWPRCIRLANKDVELIATTDVGPRIIRFGFVGAPNLFKEFADVGKTGGEVWRNYGGHRLWHAPEIKPRTYAPDNGPIEHQWDGATLKLIQPIETSTGIQKRIEITLDAHRNNVTVRHQLANKNLWPVELAPWALTVMQGPGRAILPQEPPANELLPVRSASLWGYTNMADPRWKWGAKFIQLACDPAAATPQKIGLGNKQGWAAYYREGQVFLKRFPFDPAASYPDFGCNVECYTRGDMLEVESLGPLTKLAPNTAVEHIEHWHLHKAQVGASDEEIEAAMAPLLRQKAEISNEEAVRRDH